MSLHDAACSILQRAVELDNLERFTESLVCYQEGLQILMDMLLKGESVDQRGYLRRRIEVYMKRAEDIKVLLREHNNEAIFHEQIVIENDSVGHSYQTVFSKFLGEFVVDVKIEDPYIRVHHQCQNLIRFCEMLVKNCKNLKKIEILTVKIGAEQQTWFDNIRASLLNYKVQFVVSYSQTLHDRQIVLSNDWIIKIGRGLDYFKPSEGKFCMGLYEMDLRHCHATTIDIFHKSTVKKSN